MLVKGSNLDIESESVLDKNYEQKRERSYVIVCIPFLWNFRQYCFGVGCMKLAFVLANSVPEHSEWVLERIGEIEGVEEAYRIWGVYDIVAVVKAETIEELKGIILHIRKVKHILSTLTLMVVK